jgi:hypothetical protein
MTVYYAAKRKRPGLTAPAFMSSEDLVGADGIEPSTPRV